MRYIPQEARALREGRWQTRFGRGLRGLTLGVFGYGWIGSLVVALRVATLRTLLATDPAVARACAEELSYLVDQLIRCVHDYTVGHIYPLINATKAERLSRPDRRRCDRRVDREQSTGGQSER
jgi:phosphoglycerate dehydrogenase-like enzyme